MRALSRILAAALWLSVALSPPATAQNLNSRIAVLAKPAAAALGSTWDSASAPAQIGLDATKTIATRNGSADGAYTIRATKALTADASFEIACSVCSDDGIFGLVLEAFGAVNTSQSGSAFAGVGSNGGSIRGDGLTYPDGGPTKDSGFAFHGVHTILGVWRNSSRKMWFSNDCGANWYGDIATSSENPFTGVGGLDFNTIGGGGTAITGPVYPAVTLYTGVNRAVLHTVAAQMTCAQPSGFPPIGA